MGNLSLDDAPILRTTRSYANAISALVLKLESNFIRTHPTSLVEKGPFVPVYKAHLTRLANRDYTVGTNFLGH